MLVDIESSDGEDDLGSHVTTSLPNAAIYANDGIFIEAEPTANADNILNGLRDDLISNEMTTEAWPLFLTTNAIEHESTKDTEMKAFKLRCFDDTEIRWRVEGPSQKNPLIENLLDHHKMRGEIHGLGASLQLHLWEPSSEQELPGLGKKILEDMNESSLELITWRVDVKKDAVSRIP